MSEENPENVALFDMDGTLCDYDKGLFDELEKLRNPDERRYNPPFWDSPEYITNRSALIKSSVDWWANLPKFQLGWDVLEIAEELEYRLMILTQGPKTEPNALTGKKLWIDKNLGQDFDFTMTRDKGSVYGKVLVDDFPGYIERWLQWRKRGLVIMPAGKQNEDFAHPNVIRYDGSNIDHVRYAMELARNRGVGEGVDYQSFI